MKKIFYFSIGLLILVLIFLAAYNFAFKNNVHDPVADPKEKNAVQEMKAAATPGMVGSIQNPINEALLGAAVSDDGTLYYYSLDEKTLKKASMEGKDKSVLLSDLPGQPVRVIWSPKKDRTLLLLKQSNGQNLWHYADLTTKTLVPLKPEMARLAWNNLGDKIFYQYTATNNERTLNIANPDGSAWKKLASLSQDSFISPVPQSTAVSFWNRPSALEKTSFETIGLSGESRRVLLSEKFGADYLWSPNGEKVLVGVSNEKGGQNILLNMMNGNGGEFQSLSLPTFVSKAAWSKDSRTIYYALPGGLPDSATLPNDYFDKPLITKDTFWKMDVGTGKKTRLTDLKDVAQSFDSSDLFMSPKEDILFFTDRVTHRLYRIDL
ncbi:MAG: hypothetical protein A3J06_01010 [Candidatus Moranbacteria bacterium RIFCSPLOWO2_02_FULL_48_19]|nr:MAG: hypothetical protein A3J06_01010 [Candidatus Moranbacteria bacterium RIFCSPLOWO2_02_FULL_48_19]